MKRFIILSLFAVLGIAASAQDIYKFFANDTTEGVETTYTSGVTKIRYDGIVNFSFTVEHDDAQVILQGSTDDFTNNIINIDTASHTGATGVNYSLIDSPAKYLRYRLEKTTASGDTAYYSDQLLMFKR